MRNIIPLALILLSSCATKKIISESTVKADSSRSSNIEITGGTTGISLKKIILDTSVYKHTYTTYQYDTIRGTVYKTKEVITEQLRGSQVRTDTIYYVDTSRVVIVDTSKASYIAAALETSKTPLLGTSVATSLAIVAVLVGAIAAFFIFRKK